MRPVSSKQSAIRCPLNQVFGKEAHVRLLRVLAEEVDGPLTAPDLAHRAGLTGPGTRNALARLVRSGFVRFVGGGRRPLFSLVPFGPLAEATIELFRAEHRRYNQLLDALREAARRADPPPVSVWAHGFPAGLGDSIEIALLQKSREISASASSLRERLGNIEEQFDVTLEITAYTPAELPPLEPSEILLLSGIPPLEERLTPKQSKKTDSHKNHDSRSLQYARVISELIEEDLSLIKRARNHLECVLEEEQGAAEGALREWQSILDSYPLHRLQRFLVSSSPRAARLRQSSPFPAVLTDDERTAVMQSLGEKL